MQPLRRIICHVRVDRLLRRIVWVEYDFLLADWTPWQAIPLLLGDWPVLAFEIRARYDVPDGRAVADRASVGCGGG